MPKLILLKLAKTIADTNFQMSFTCIHYPALFMVSLFSSRQKLVLSLHSGAKLHAVQCMQCMQQAGIFKKVVCP